MKSLWQLQKRFTPDDASLNVNAALACVELY